MLSNFIAGLGFAFSGFRLIIKKGIRPFVVIPLLVNIVVFSAAIWTGFKAFNQVTERLLGWLPSWLDWILWLLWPLAIFVVFVMVYYSFTLIANLIAAPFNSLLSERVELLLAQKPVPPFQGFEAIPGMIGRTVWSETRKILYQVKWLIGLVILSFIPGINLLAPFAWGYFTAWMLAIAYTEYPMGNREIYFAAVKKRLKSDRVTALGVGTGLMVITLVPVVNFIAMPVGVAGGTCYWVKRLNNI